MIALMVKLNSDLHLSDKIIIPTGAAVSSASLLTQVQTWMGVAVGFCTLVLILLRIVKAWKDLK